MRLLERRIMRQSSRSTRLTTIVVSIRYDLIPFTIRSIISPYVGRPWLASEIRRKSFKDLHTLWYILARERNLLATQAHEARRLSIDTRLLTSIQQRTMRVRLYDFGLSYPSIDNIFGSVKSPWRG